MQVGFVEPHILVNATNGVSVETSASRGRGVRGRGRFGSSGGRSYSGRGNSTRVCSFCRKTGHLVDSCYKKHGYPPNFFKSRTINNITTEDANEETCSVHSQ